MCKRTVIVSGGMLEEDFVLPILEAEETEFIIGINQDREQRNHSSFQQLIRRIEIRLVRYRG